LLVTPAVGTVGRVGFVIGKQYLKRAVDRNCVRRALREAVRRRRPEIERFDIVLRLRARCEQSDLRGLGLEAAELLDAFLNPTAR
jgi:ribonuclease P protein component